MVAGGSKILVPVTSAAPFDSASGHHYSKASSTDGAFFVVGRMNVLVSVTSTASPGRLTRVGRLSCQRDFFLDVAFGGTGR